MPIKIKESKGRFHLIFETKWGGVPQVLGVSGAPENGYATREEATAAKKQVTIMKSGGISAATLLV